MKKKVRLFQRISLINKVYKKKERYHYFELPHVSIIVPVIKNKFLVVKQKREPVNMQTLEFPCGWVDINEKPSNSARRELYEETGYKANGIKKLIEFYEEPGRMVSKAFCFYSEKLTKINIPEKGIKIALYSKQEMINLINTKKFNAGNHIAAFYKYLSLKKI